MNFSGLNGEAFRRFFSLHTLAGDRTKMNAKNVRQKRMLFFLIFCLSIALPIRLPTEASAGLDGNRTQIQDDARKLGLVPGTTSTKNVYASVLLSLPPGSPLSQNGLKTLAVREFFDASGQVFAVAWEGSLLPDLSVLLGTRFADIPPRNLSHDRHHLFITTPGLIVRVIGTSRFRAGMAWIPSRLPPGFTLSEIRVRAP
jgi:hypothetical protein